MVSALITLILFSLLAVGAVTAVIFGLPGTWLIVAAVAYTTFGGAATDVTTSVTTFYLLLGMAVAGEVVEFAAGAAGVKKLGGAKRSAALSIIGSIAGAIVGFFVGSPIPIIGSVIVSLLFGGVGAYAGAMLGELWAGRPKEQAARVAAAAMKGRLLGTLYKLIIATTMCGVMLYAIWSGQ